MEQGDRILVIDIHLTRGLAIVLGLITLAVIVLGGVIRGPERASAADGPAAPAAYSGLRQFYLSKLTYTGATAASACTAGYHMASLWEIMEPSNLKYNTSLGLMQGDSGQGPPSFAHGWVRTGYGTTWNAAPGSANCLGYTTGDADATGTVVRLALEWTVAQDIHVWEAFELACNQVWFVWCVED